MFDASVFGEFWTWLFETAMTVTLGYFHLLIKSVIRSFDAIKDTELPREISVVFVFWVLIPLVLIGCVRECFAK